MPQRAGTIYPKVDRIYVEVPLAAADVARTVFIAPRKCRLVSVRETHAVAGGAGAVVAPRKITDTSAPGAGVSATVVDLSGTVALNGAANTVISVTPTSGIEIAAGNRVAVSYGGTLTGLAGGLLQLEFQVL